MPQVFDFIQRARLTFGRWVKQAPYSPQCGVIARLPQAVQITGLPPAEQFAAVELFRGTMVRHSVIVYRDDSPSPFGPVSFAERMAELCADSNVRNDLRSGAAPCRGSGVLINQNHTYTDLFMPIEAAEKRMFDAIDAHRSIGDILKATPTSPSDNPNQTHAPSSNGSGGMTRWYSTHHDDPSGPGHPTRLSTGSETQMPSKAPLL